jgi:hypothetical protein
LVIKPKNLFSHKADINADGPLTGVKGSNSMRTVLLSSNLPVGELANNSFVPLSGRNGQVADNETVKVKLTTSNRPKIKTTSLPTTQEDSVQADDDDDGEEAAEVSESKHLGFA